MLINHNKLKVSGLVIQHEKDCGVVFAEVMKLPPRIATPPKLERALLIVKK